VIYLIKKNEDTQGKPVLCRVQKFLVQVIVVPSSNRWEGPYDVYGQKVRHKMVVSHWCCGEGEGHMVIQPLCRVWGVGRIAASMPVKGGVKNLRS